MAKRFTDTRKWDKEWFMELSPKGKLLWIFLCDSCDHAGIWEENYKLASCQIGLEVTSADLSEIAKNIVSLEDRKVFVPGFIEFQYGQLDSTNRAHSSAIRILEKYGIDPKTLAPSKGLISPIQGRKDKDKDKDKEDSSREGGMGETTEPPKLSAKEIEFAAAIWKRTLDHFKCGREVLQPEKEQIAKMLLSKIPLQELCHALSGMRFEEASPSFTPAKHVNINRIWEQKLRIKFITLSTQEEQRRKIKMAERGTALNSSGALNEKLDAEYVQDPEAIKKLTAEAFKTNTQVAS